MSAQAAHDINATTPFAFLSAPPPFKQKRRAASPLPCPVYSPPPPPQTPRSSSFSRIANWAAQVHPGSPAPLSPPSLGRRTSISHGRARSGSLAHLVDTQSAKSPSTANFDLTALGYTSLFVHIPETPTTPLKQHQQKQNRTVKHASVAPLSASFAFSHIPIPPVPQDTAHKEQQKGMKRFRSLSILRPKSKILQPTVVSPTKTVMSIKSTTSKRNKTQAVVSCGSAIISPTSCVSRESKAEICAATIVKRKRAKYAYVRPPPPLANELAIMQFTGGGKMESHVKRVMEAQAKAAAGSGASIGVADVYRDEQGGIWWDADEELEYAHLLGGTTPAVETRGQIGRDVEMDWEEFNDAGGLLEHNSSFPLGAPDKENTCPYELPTRRSSVSSVDSDLDPKYLVPLPENEDPKLTPIEDRILVSRRVGGANMSILSLPARPRRRAMHLCKPAFLVDAKIWEGSASGPTSPTRSTTSASSKHIAGGVTKQKGKSRRRPAPLKLVSASASDVSRFVVRQRSASTVSTTHSVQKARNEFIADSFSPVLPTANAESAQRQSLDLVLTDSEPFSLVSTSSSNIPAPSSKAPRSKLAMGVRGLFRRGD